MVLFLWKLHHGTFQRSDIYTPTSLHCISKQYRTRMLNPMFADYNATRRGFLNVPGKLVRKLPSSWIGRSLSSDQLLRPHPLALALSQRSPSFMSFKKTIERRGLLTVPTCFCYQVIIIFEHGSLTCNFLDEELNQTFDCYCWIKCVHWRSQRCYLIISS